MSGIWGVIASVGDVSILRVEVFNKGVGFKVREATCVRFWVNDWLGMGPLSGLFPRLFRMVFDKNSLVKVCYIPNGSRVSCDVSFRRFYIHMK